MASASSVLGSIGKRVKKAAGDYASKGQSQASSQQGKSQQSASSPANDALGKVGQQIGKRVRKYISGKSE